MPSFFIGSFDMLSLAIVSFFIESFDIVSLDIVSFFMSSAKAAGVSGVKVKPAEISAERSILVFIGYLREIDVTHSPVSQGSNTSSSVSRCRKLALGSRFCDNNAPDKEQ